MRQNFSYVFSCELNVPLRVRVVSLLGFLTNSSQPSGHMLLRIAVYCNNRKVGCDVQTSYRAPTAVSGTSRELQKWDELLTLPIRYCELSRDAILHITLWDVGDSIEPVFVAQCVKPLFSKHGVLRSGQLDLRLDRPESGTPDPVYRAQTGLADRSKGSRTGAGIAELLKKEKLHKENFIDHVSWLDQITFSRLAKIKEDAKTEDRSLYVTLEMPTVFDTKSETTFSVIFFVEDDDNLLNTTSRSMGAANLNGAAAAGHRGVDPELGLDNLCEMKHHMMTRNARSNDIDRRLQPNPASRDMLEAIIRSPSCQPMTVEQRDLIWKFRFWLKSSPHALTKFIRSVNWDEEPEVKQAMQVIAEWEPIDACDALELLTPSFTHPFVRRYAVSRLQRTTFANILLYLPQLVQALRYEGKGNDMLFVNKEAMSNESMKRSSVEGPSAKFTEISKSIVDFFGDDVDLAKFLIHAACENSEIANYLYWYLKVEVEANEELDEPVSEMYAQMIDRLKRKLAQGNNTARQALATSNTQKKFVDTLVEMAKLVAEVSGSRAKKLEVLKKKLSENTDLMDLKGLSLPLDPSIHVKSINAEATVLFSSNLMPMKLTFSTVRGAVAPYECGEAYTTIFKRGDDLRQDQLVLQMIRLMDSLLKEDKLDLCLTPYSVLATSVSDGFVQFIRSIPLADLKGTIQDTLRQYRPSPSGPYNIEAEVLNNYVRSCAGYSIICYILGIGDRHLHNLLLCENGKMFHVDFGFILGRDPKPMPPAMKLTSEMINAMGGQQSEHFKNFVDYCTTAFCILRRHANLITNLFSLMLDAGIPDIAVEKDKAVQKVLERFHLHLSDESACQLVNRLIESSISAKMPILVDFVHDVKQYISN